MKPSTVILGFFSSLVIAAPTTPADSNLVERLSILAPVCQGTPVCCSTDVVSGVVSSNCVARKISRSILGLQEPNVNFFKLTNEHSCHASNHHPRISSCLPARWESHCPMLLSQRCKCPNSGPDSVLWLTSKH